MVIKLSPWTTYDSGSTIGKPGSERGTIVRDEGHELGAQITLERDTDAAAFAITCGISGWMVHTRFLSIESEATGEYELMKTALETILELIPYVDDPQVTFKMQRVTEAIERFVNEFP